MRRTSRRHHRRLSLVVACSLAALVATGRAGADSPVNGPLAQALFDEGKRLYERGDYPRACEKFAASYQSDAKLGTLLNLAVCHEKMGKTATAWAEYGQARAQALRENRRDRAELAQKRFDDLSPRVPKLRIRVNHRGAVSVSLDGQAISPAALEIPIPVDPGSHRLEAAAPGHVAWSAIIEVASSTDVAVPALSPLPTAPTVTTAPTATTAPAGPVAESAPPVRPEPVERATEPAGKKTWGVATTALGVASLGAAAYFGLRAFALRSDAEDACRRRDCPLGASLNDDATTHAWIANGAVVLGAGLLVAGVYLLTRPPPSIRSAANGQLTIPW